MYSCLAAGDALDAVELLLPDGISVFAFDFSGSGHSDGDTISLGFYEKFDVECVVKHLRSNVGVSTIGIWGRSMGAATALLYAQMDPSIACLVLDSAFTSLNRIMHELAAQYAILPLFPPKRHSKAFPTQPLWQVRDTHPAAKAARLWRNRPASPCNSAARRL
jgi:pimeloyl-ACP methyl ester carboxylesterase